MAGFDVEIAALRKAGQAARSAGAQAAAVDLAGPFAAVTGALPGSRSASASVAAGDGLQDRVIAFSRLAADLGQNMNSAAARYDRDDEAARDDLVANWKNWLPALRW